MKSAVACLLVLSLVSVVVLGQNTNQNAKRGTSKTGPEASPARGKTLKRSGVPPAPVAPAKASRPRKVGNATENSVALNPPEEISPAYVGPPELKGSLARAPLNAPGNVSSSTSLDDEQEVGEGDVVRIDTNLVTVPVSVLDREGRFISDLRREEFKVLENGVEQKIAYFDSTEKPFTVALLLDTSGSTFFHLWEIKEAAINFAKQLRPQDRVLVVTFDRLVMLLTEATNDLNVVTEVIQRNAITGFSTRLYDGIDLVIKARLNKIDGRKAIVLFTDGVDTASYHATYQSTLREVEELEALIYPVQYDTTDFVDAQTRTNATIVTTTISGRHLPTQSSSRVFYGTPKASGPGTSLDDYKLADQYLHQLATKTGGRLYAANDRAQLSNAFSKIAEELRHQYSLGYYPQATLESGERREIKVRVDRAGLAVRARDSYVKRVTAKP